MDFHWSTSSMQTCRMQWIFKKKLRPQGTVDKYKTRLVAKGYTQQKSIDFFDTYSSVARICYKSFFSALAIVYKMIIYQMDVKTIFLNGDLEEAIYMNQPEGFITKGQEKNMQISEVLR